MYNSNHSTQACNNSICIHYACRYVYHLPHHPQHVDGMCTSKFCITRRAAQFSLLLLMCIHALSQVIYCCLALLPNDSRRLASSWPASTVLHSCNCKKGSCRSSWHQYKTMLCCTKHTPNLFGHCVCDSVTYANSTVAKQAGPHLDQGIAET